MPTNRLTGLLLICIAGVAYQPKRRRVVKVPDGTALRLSLNSGAEFRDQFRSMIRFTSKLWRTSRWRGVVAVSEGLNRGRTRRRG